MIPARYETILFQFFISAMMSCLVSGMVSLINLGAAGFSLSLWLNAWLLAWSVAFPTIVIMSPLVRKLVKAIVKAV